MAYPACRPAPDQHQLRKNRRMKIDWKKVSVYLAFFLIAAIIFIVMQCQAGEEYDLSQNAKISRLEAMDRENRQVQAAQDSVIRDLSHSLDSTSKASAKSDSLFHVERSQRGRDRGELVRLRAELGIVPDTITVQIEGNFQAQIDSDSIQIQKLEARILSDSTNYTGIIQGWVAKFNSEVSVTEAWRIQAVDATKDAQKYKKQRNQARWIAAGQAFAIVILALIIAL